MNLGRGHDKIPSRTPNVNAFVHLIPLLLKMNYLKVEIMSYLSLCPLSSTFDSKKIIIMELNKLKNITMMFCSF